MPLMPASRATTVEANSVRRALAVIGDRWTLLILRDAFLGVHQFGTWQERLGITPAVLTRRLKHLTAHGILRREQTRGVPARVEYHLTERGFDLYGNALMVLRWEQRWFGGTMIVLRHTRCGNITEPRCSCGNCGEDITPRDVRNEPGPGARLEKISEKRIRRTVTASGSHIKQQRFLEHAVEILGDRWTWETIGAAFLGRKRFDEIQASTGMATNILSDRLRRLCADGLFARKAYQQNPVRHEYVLTAKGRDLFPAILMLLRWGDLWLAGNAGVPTLLFHKLCNGPLEPHTVCSACGKPLDAHEMSYEFSDGSVAKILPRAS